jgi:hypothetical protein
LKNFAAGNLFTAKYSKIWVAVGEVPWMQVLPIGPALVTADFKTTANGQSLVRFTNHKELFHFYSGCGG